MIIIKPKDKMTLDKINLHREKDEKKDEIRLENYGTKCIYDRYEVLLPLDCSIVENNLNSESNKYIYERVIFSFKNITDTKSNKDKYLEEQNGDEDIQILNCDIQSVVQYRKIEEVTKFYSVSFFEFGEETLLAEFCCDNNKSAEWEKVFIEIFKSIKEIEGFDTQDE